jgi:hypothetical protein
MGKLERARIYVLSKDSAQKEPKEEDDFIEVCFNPKEYALDKTVEWTAEKAFADAEKPQIGQPKAMTLSVTLQFDTYEERVSVRDKYLRKLERMTLLQGKPEKKEKQDQREEHHPPVILFVWGRFTFKGVIETLQQKYTMFLSDGTPVRADAVLKIRNVIDVFDEDATVERAKNKQPKIHTVAQNDRLDLIADKYFKDPKRWSQIADWNRVVDPVGITDGDGNRIEKLEIPE